VSSRTEERKNDLRHTTVMEVIIAVTLILMLIIYFKDVDHLDQTKLNEDKIIKQENEIVLLKKKINELEKENRVLRSENKDLKATIKRLYEDIEPGASGIKDLKEFVKSREADLKKKIAELEEIIFNLKKKFKVVNKDASVITRLNAEIARLKAEIKALTAELNKFKSKVKGVKKAGGKGAPRCVISSGEVRWLAEIRKIGGTFKFELVGSDAIREELVKEVSGVRSLTDKGLLNEAEFKKASDAIYNWGLNQKVPCRFYVKIYKENMNWNDSLFIEQFFYIKVIK
jgi:predicted RNase H-like nuclease (RuvC/YqgF family)